MSYIVGHPRRGISGFPGRYQEDPQFESRSNGGHPPNPKDQAPAGINSRQQHASRRRRAGEAWMKREGVRESFFGRRSPSVRELSVVGGASKQNKDEKYIEISLHRPTNSVVD
jgi:hypothetical protein